jgi:hypothetical protein
LRRRRRWRRRQSRRLVSMRRKWMKMNCREKLGRQDVRRGKRLFLDLEITYL